MKKNIFICIIILSLICLIILLLNSGYKNDNENNNKYDNEIPKNDYVTIDKNQISYKEDVDVNELKNDYGISADSDIYEIETEYDGRKVLTIKASLKFKVAFSGLIKKEKPQLEKLDEVMQNNYPQKNGIWIENNSRDRIVKMLNKSEILKSVYVINEEGYLEINEKNNQTELDKKIEKAINGNNQIILAVSSICYIVDDVTGEILDYNFENMDKFQTYECFNDTDKKIVFITENNNNQILNDNMVEDFINIL